MKNRRKRKKRRRRNNSSIGGSLQIDAYTSRESRKRLKMCLPPHSHRGLGEGEGQPGSIERFSRKGMLPPPSSIPKANKFLMQPCFTLFASFS